MLEELNNEQYEAATCNDRTVLCLAAAGTGKTKTLISRVRRLVSQGVNPNTILCLTFTNAAALEMKERYKKAAGSDIVRGCPEFRTFHSFCYSLIIKDKAVREELGYTNVPQICEDAQLKEIKTKVKLAIGCKLSDSQLEKDVSLSRKDQDMKELFLKALNKEIRKENVITFDMMCYNVCELFEKHEQCVEQYRQKYKYICIDEFQDSDKRQLKFANSFPSDTNFWFCGDALQNLYSFRGTTNEYVKLLSTDPNWKVVRLHTNYRSTKQICDFANKFSKYAKDDYRIEMTGLRDGDEPEVIYGSMSSYEHPVDERHLDILVDMLLKNKNQTAILCRTNKECAAVKARLTRANIEYTGRASVGDIVDILKSSLSNDYMLDWLATKLESVQYADYIRLAAQNANPDIRWFLTTYGSVSAIKHSAQQVIGIRNVVSNNTITPKDKFEQVTKLLRIKSKCEFKGDDNTSNKDIIESILDQIQEMQESTIYCGTIHSSKGLEYDTVYVMGVNDKMFKLGTEDMNNLAYVAYTRARNHLIVFKR